MRTGLILMLAVLIAGPVFGQAAVSPVGTVPQQHLRIGVLRVDTPGLPPISRLRLAPADLGLAGARLAVQDNDTTGRFTGQDFDTVDAVVAPAEAMAALDQMIADGVGMVVALADDATTLALADRAGDRAMILNARAQGDNLRGVDCRQNLIHVAPSRAMLTDALAQFLMVRQWPRWMLISGSHPDDKALADAWRRAATKFGAKIVEEREYTDRGGARATDTGFVQVQKEIPLLTQRAKDYDILIAADEAGVFAGYLSYQTWDPRPVAGSAGLMPTSWHPAMEAWGGTQFQSRFEKLANRPVRADDYQAWLAVRMLGEAATRAKSVEPAALRQVLLDPGFDVAGFKGQKLTIRDWDHQLRQPILLTTDLLLTSVSPQDQYLHRVSALDTLGTDRPETTCKF